MKQTLKNLRKHLTLLYYNMRTALKTLIICAYIYINAYLMCNINDISKLIGLFGIILLSIMATIACSYILYLLDFFKQRS